MDTETRPSSPAGPGWRATVCATRPGHVVNEDAVAVTDHAMIVVDGASGLDKACFTGWPSDAQWFAHRLSTLLTARIEDATVSIPDILRDCLGVLRAEFTHLADSPVTAIGTLPSAAVMIARTHASTLDIFSLGDCQAVIGHRDGSTSVCHDPTVEALDQAVVATMSTWARAHHTTNRDARDRVTDQLLRNRRLMNTDGGYWIADLTGAGIPHARSQTFHTDEVRDLALMTDGFAAATSLVHLFDTPAQLLHTLRTTAPELVTEALFTRLAADPDYTAYPRLKHIDDSTVAYANLHDMA